MFFIPTTKLKIFPVLLNMMMDLSINLNLLGCLNQKEN